MELDDSSTTNDDSMREYFEEARDELLSMIELELEQ